MYDSDTGDTKTTTASSIVVNLPENAAANCGGGAGGTESSNHQQQQQLQPQPREALINTAITFLQNQNVKRSPLNQKQKFLRSKGLTENEIQIACERAGIFTVDPNNSNSTIINNIPNDRSNYATTQKTLSQPTLLQKIKDILTSTAIIAGITYGIYLFYKKFIEPLLFRKKKRKTISESLDEMDRKWEKNLIDLNGELIKIKDELTTTVRNTTVAKDIQNFKSDIEAIKGLLLNRKQFSVPVVPPSIPAWQLQSQMTQQHHHHHHPNISSSDADAEVEVEKNDDAGSGSGSSETEVVTKNSDSSIEMM